MANLKKLIQQVKNSEIPWDTEIKLNSRLVVNKSLKDVSSKNWEKIRHITPSWSDQQNEDSTQLITRKIKNKKFASEETLKKFKEYANSDLELKVRRKETRKLKISKIEKEDVIEDNWDNIVNSLKKSHKIYGRDGDSCAFQNENMLIFLQKMIINDDFISTIEYRRDEVFKLEE